MSEKYKIHINPKQPDKSEINRYKNFSRVVDDYEKLHQPGYIIRNLHRNKRLFRLIILILVILLTLFLTHESGKEEKKDNAPQKDKQTESNESFPSNK